jgi:hypothetical protein
MTFKKKEKKAFGPKKSNIFIQFFMRVNLKNFFLLLFAPQGKFLTFFAPQVKFRYFCLPRRENLYTFVSRAGKIFNFFAPQGKFFLAPIGEKLCFFGPDRGKNCVFLVPIGEKIVFFWSRSPDRGKICVFGRDRLFYIMLFNVMIHDFPFFHQKTAGTGKPGKKRETATTLVRRDRDFRLWSGSFGIGSFGIGISEIIGIPWDRDSGLLIYFFIFQSNIIFFAPLGRKHTYLILYFVVC